MPTSEDRDCRRLAMADGSTAVEGRAATRVGAAISAGTDE